MSGFHEISGNPRVGIGRTLAQFRASIFALICKICSSILSVLVISYPPYKVSRFFLKSAFLDLRPFPRSSSSLSGAKITPEEALHSQSLFRGIEIKSALCKDVPVRLFRRIMQEL